jgi:putative ABC transport system ATP-binding protein
MGVVGACRLAQAGERLVSLLSVERVTLRYPSGQPGRPERMPIKDASFEVDAGEIVAVMGRGRSGRSTLLRLAAGVVQPTEGSVRFAGRPVVDDRLLGMPQGIGFSHFRFERGLGATVLEHVGVSSLAMGMRPKTVNDRVEKALARTGIAHCADMSPVLLEYADLVRASIARALVSGPRLLLVDGPTYGVDLADRDGILDLLRSLARDRIAVLFTASSGTELAGVDRVMRIDAGTLRGDTMRKEATVYELPHRESGS